MAEVVLRSQIGLLLSIPSVVGFLMLRRTLRGEESCRDTDRRFFLGDQGMRFLSPLSGLKGALDRQIPAIQGGHANIYGGLVEQ